MKSQLLTQELWSTAAKLAKKAKRREAAIAYVTSERVKFGRGDTLITDASQAAITSGETDAKILLAAHLRGAAIYSCPDLHAKVLLLDDVAIIGSANLSANSADYLQECAVMSQDPALVGQVRAMLQGLRERCECMDTQALEKLASLPVIRKPGRRHGGKGSPKMPRVGQGRWMIGTTPIDEEELSESDLQTRERALDQVKTKTEAERKKLQWIRLIGQSKMRSDAQRGDRLIVVDGSHANRLQVLAPCTILACEKGEKAMFLYYDPQEAGKKKCLGKMEMVKLLKELNSALNPSAKMVRRVSVSLFDQLEGHWPKAGKKA